MHADNSGAHWLSSKEQDLRWPDTLVVALLVLLAFLLYANTLTGGFVYDDHPQLVDNPYVTSFKHLREIFFTNVWSFQGAQGTTNYYRPMMTLGFLFGYKLFGLLPFGFHLMNIVLHAAVVCFVFFFTRRVFNSAQLAILAAALFALHPIHTESVAWIAGVTDIELTFFYLLTFWIYVRLGDAQPRNARARYIPLILCYLFALLSKEQALTLPVLATLFEHFYRDDRNRTPFSVKLQRYGALWISAAAYLAFRSILLGAFAPILHRPELSSSATLQSALSLVISYLGKLMWPLQLSAFHVFRETNTWTQSSAVLGIVVVALYFAAFLLLWIYARPVSFALLWLFVTLAPVLNPRWMAANVFAERYLYLPSVGFCWLAAYCGVWLWRERQTRPLWWRRGLVAAGSLIAALLAIRTVLRNRDWHDDLTLYTQTLQVSPEAHLIRANLGTVYWRQGDIAASEREWRMVISKNPTNVVTLNNLGLLCKEQHRFSEAVDFLNRAIALKPTYANAHVNLGMTLEAMGQSDRALAELRTAVSLAPLNAEAQYHLGSQLFKGGQLEEARERFLDSIAAGATGVAYSSLGEILLRQGYRDHAESYFREALKLEPFDSQVHLQLGKLLQEAGRTAEAAREFESVLTLDPSNSHARVALGLKPAMATSGVNTQP